MSGPSLWERLKRARPVQVLVTYLAASWVVLQIVEILQESLELPAWVLPVSFVLLLVGLLIVAVERMPAAERQWPALRLFFTAAYGRGQVQRGIGLLEDPDGVSAADEGRWEAHARAREGLRESLAAWTEEASPDSATREEANRFFDNRLRTLEGYAQWRRGDPERARLPLFRRGLVRGGSRAPADGGGSAAGHRPSDGRPRLLTSRRTPSRPVVPPHSPSQP